jgi:hypothetical protein
VKLRFLAPTLAAFSLLPAHAFASGEFVYPASGSIGVATGTYLEIDGGGDCTAARAGQVTYADTSDGQNYTVIVQHEAGYETFYEQLNFDTLAVNQGDQVNAGDEVGQSNATGFEIHRWGAPQVLPGNVGDSVNQGDPIAQTYGGLGGTSSCFTTLAFTVRSSWVGNMGTLTVNADGSFSRVIPPRPGSKMETRTVTGNLTSDELSDLNNALATISNDGASLDGRLPGIVADGSMFTLDSTLADGSTHELGGFEGIYKNARWGNDPGVVQLLGVLDKVFARTR